MGAKFETSLFLTARKETEDLSTLSRCAGLNRGKELALRLWGCQTCQLHPLQLRSVMHLWSVLASWNADNSASNANLKQYICYQHLCSWLLIIHNEKLMWGITKDPIIRLFFKGWKTHPWAVPENLSKALKTHWNNYFLIITQTHNLNTKGKHCIPLKSNKILVL